MRFSRYLRQLRHISSEGVFKTNYRSTALIVRSSAFLGLSLAFVATSLSSAPPTQIILAPDVESGRQTPQVVNPSGLTNQNNVPTKVQQTQVETNEKYSKLEDLYKRGLISKEVFEQRKPPKALTFEEKLARLKDLRSKGLITKEVYEARQKELLDANL